MRGVGAILGALALGGTLGVALWLVAEAPESSSGPVAPERSTGGTIASPLPVDDVPQVDERPERTRVEAAVDVGTVWPPEDLPPPQRVRRIVRFLCQEDRPDWALRAARPVLRAHPDLAVAELARGLRFEHGLDVCAGLLAEFGPAAEGALLELRRFLSEEPELVTRALVAIGAASLDEILTGIESSDVEIRRHVVWEVGSWNRHRDGTPSELVTAVEERLDDPDAKVREAALRAVVHLSDASDLVTEALVAGLDDESVEVRRRVLDQMSRLDAYPRRLVPKLIELLGDEDRQVAVDAAHALAEIGPAARAASPELVRRIRADTRASADEQTHAWFVALGSVDRPALRTLAADASEFVRMQAVYQLDYDDSGDRPLILAALADAEWPVRRSAMTTLLGPRRREARQVTEAFCEALAKRLRGSHVAERRYALRMLAGQPELPQSVAGAIRALLDDDDVVVRRLATEALGRLPDALTRSLDRLLVALTDDSADVRLEALDALRVLTPEDAEAVRAVRRLLPAREPLVRVHAARALLAMKPGAADVLPVLEDLRVDKSPRVRELVVVAAGELGTDDALGLLVSRLRDKSRAVQKAAARALRPYGPRGAPALDNLMSRLELGYHDVWIECMATLAAMGSAARPAAPLLERHTRSELLPVREAAARALDAIRGSGDARKRSTAASDAGTAAE